ncbi:MAG: RDD family protein [Thermoanaerobaculia bacterium]
MELEVRCKNHPEVTEGCVRCARCGEWVCSDCRVELDGRPYCAECKVEYLRDLRAGVTPSGQLAYAGVWRRFCAIFLDGLLFAIPYALWFAYMIASGAMEPEADPDVIGIIGLIVVLLWATVGRIVYEGSMLAHGGQTLGKRAMSVKVVTPEGHDLRPGQAWGRAILRFVFEGCISFVDYLPAVFTQEKTTVHDLAAKTRVIDLRQGGR